MKWTLENSLPIIRAIAPIGKRCNFCVALRGSVLLKGESDNDLDLYFVAEEDPEGCSVGRFLEEMTDDPPNDVERCDPPSGGSLPRTFIWLRDGRRIDAHFIQTGR
jgi:hypothetical protein